MKDIKSKILYNRQIIPGYFKATLKAPYIANNSVPGQFVQVRCSDATEPLLRRPFSIHRVKSDRVELLYEVIGKGTNILSQKKEGDVVDVLGPLGNGFTISLKPSAALVGGGIGVAPLVFLAEELKKKKINTTVLLGGRTKNLILCKKDFKNAGADVYISTDDGTCGHKGFVTDLLGQYLSTVNCQSSTVYACGPNAMLKRVSEICEDFETDCEVSLEERMACGIGACLGCAVNIRGKNPETKMVCKDGPVFKANKIIWQ
jgi:dihydroorotate dehydrogenase electron transfer subunit